MSNAPSSNTGPPMSPGDISRGSCVHTSWTTFRVPRGQNSTDIILNNALAHRFLQQIARGPLLLYDHFPVMSSTPSPLPPFLSPTKSAPTGTLSNALNDFTLPDLHNTATHTTDTHRTNISDCITRPSTNISRRLDTNAPKAHTSAFAHKCS